MPNSILHLKDDIETYAQVTLKLYSKLSFHNIVAALSEQMVCDVLNLKKAKRSQVGYDAVDEKNKKTYQIKSRWNVKDSTKGQNEFGKVTKRDGKYPFDFLIIVYYKDDFFTPEVFKISANKIETVLCKKGNGYIFRYTNNRIKHEDVENISSEFSNYWSN